MTTPRALRPMARLTPLLASLAICAFATPRASAGGCSHGVDATTPKASATLQILQIAEDGGPSWTPPGMPCNGPRCRSKAPAADAATAPVALVARHEALSPATAVLTPPSSALISRAEPLLSPTRAPLALERPPRGA